MSVSTVARPDAANIANSRSSTAVALLAFLRWGPVLASVVLVVLFQIPFLSEPMERDEGFHFTMVTSGDLPYVNAFDNKPPITYFWYYLALWLNGGTASAFTIHVIVTVLLSLTAVAVYATGRAMRDHAFGVCAALVFSLFIANQFLQFNGNTESLALLPLTLSLLAFVLAYKRDDLWLFALAGTFGAIAALTRTSMAFNLAALIVFLLWTRRSEARTWADTFRPIAVMVLASSLAGLIAFIPWVVAGHVEEFWQANVTATINYSSRVSADGRLAFALIYNLQPLGAGVLLWALAFAGSFASIIPSKERSLVRLWLLASLFAISWTGYFYPHYFIQMLPGAALCAAAAIYQIASRWHRLRSRIAFTPLLAVLTGLMLWGLSGFYLVSDIDERTAAKWGSLNAEKNKGQSILAQRVQDLSAPNDAIYVLGPDPQLYALSDRRPAARVFSTQWLINDPVLVDETIQQLERSLPELIVDDSFYVWSEKTYELLPDDIRTVFSGFISKHYELTDTVNSGAQIAYFYSKR